MDVAPGFLLFAVLFWRSEAVLAASTDVCVFERMFYASGVQQNLSLLVMLMSRFPLYWHGMNLIYIKKNNMCLTVPKSLFSLCDHLSSLSRDLPCLWPWPCDLFCPIEGERKWQSVSSGQRCLPPWEQHVAGRSWPFCLVPCRRRLVEPTRTWAGVWNRATTADPQMLSE